MFGLLLIHSTPLLVEAGILLDVTVGVFIIGIIVDRIQRAPVLRVCVRRLGLDRDFRRLRQRVSVQQDGQRGRVPGTFRVG